VKGRIRFSFSWVRLAALKNLGIAQPDHLANRGMSGEAIFALICFSGSQANALTLPRIEGSALKRRIGLKLCVEGGRRIGHDAGHVGYHAKFLLDI